jgi:hypothetical protein
MDQAAHNKIVPVIRGIEANLGSCSHFHTGQSDALSRRQKE